MTYVQVNNKDTIREQDVMLIYFFNFRSTV